MIVITGSITAKPGRFELLQAEALAHSARSRTEDGCLAHRCFVELDAPDRLFFYEEWRDMAAVAAHFDRSDTGRITAAARAHAAASDGPIVLSAKRVRPSGGVA